MYYFRWRRHCSWQSSEYWSASFCAVFLAIRLVTYCFIKFLSLLCIRLGYYIDKRLWVLLAPFLGNVEFARLEGALRFDKLVPLISQQAWQPFAERESEEAPKLFQSDSYPPLICLKCLAQSDSYPPLICLKCLALVHRLFNSLD